MTTMWVTNTLSISDLIKMVQDTRLALPSFQRPSVWTKADWVPFLSTVLRNRPTGTLLLLDVGTNPQEFAPRSITNGVIDITNLRHLLLDGQQRTTTIYKAFKTVFADKNGNNAKAFVLNVKDALDREELLEEDLKLTPVNSIQDPSIMGQLGKIDIRILLDSELLTTWKYNYADRFIAPGADGGAKLERLLDQIIPGFKTVSEYKFPILEIKEETPLDVVVDIFEGMNRRGQKLNQFDLMVARLYKELPTGDFYNLREHWESALGDCPNLKAIGVSEEEGMLPLQLIALQLSRLDDGIRPPKIKGLNNSDVLETPAAQIIEEEIGNPVLPRLIPGLHLRSAVNALDKAAFFLKNHCGVVDAQLLPQISMLLPLADQMLKPEAEQLPVAKLKKWFFSVGLRTDYYGGVNSYVARDCKALKLWQKESIVPNYLETIDKNFVDGLDLRQTMNREGSILGKTLMCILVSKGALDWVAGQLQLSSLGQRIEFHHMIPDKRLKQWYRDKDERRPIANMTPISSSANSSIGDKNPVQIINDLGVEAIPTLNSHRVNKDHITLAYNDKNSFEVFLDQRQLLLKELAVEALGLQ